MDTNKTFLWVLAVLLSGAFCAFSAVAQVSQPDAYQRLTAVDLSPDSSPRTMNGLSDLAGSEPRYREHLPLQLSSAITRINRTEYRRRH